MALTPSFRQQTFHWSGESKQHIAKGSAREMSEQRVMSVVQKLDRLQLAQSSKPKSLSSYRGVRVGSSCLRRESRTSALQLTLLSVSSRWRPQCDVAALLSSCLQTT